MVAIEVFNPPIGRRTELFKSVDIISHINNSASSIPLSLRGQPLLNLATDIVKTGAYSQISHEVAHHALRTAFQAYAISVGNENLYMRHQTISAEASPDLSDFKFVSELNYLRKYGLDYQFHEIRELEIIDNLLQTATEISKSEYLLSPFFDTNGTTPVQANFKREITEVIRNVASDIAIIKTKGKASNLKVLHRPLALVTNSVTRAHLLPISTPINTEARDFDSGYCDKFSNTSFRKGDKVRVLAAYKNYRLITSCASYGWVDATDIALVSIQDEHELRNYFREEFYVGYHPFFYRNGKNTVMLPGDTMFNDGKRHYTLERDELGNIVLQRINGISSDLVSPLRNTPQDLVDFLYGCSLPYMFSTFDCSEVIRRGFVMLGYQVRKYSGDLLQDLQNAALEPIQIKTPALIDNLDDGLYLVGLMTPPITEARTRHLYLVSATAGIWRTFSYAFAIIGDKGFPEYPIGPHISGKDALLHQVKGDRELVFYKIAVKA